MANVITPKLSNVGGNINLKTYNYGGSLKASSASSAVASYEQIDYSFNPTKKKAATLSDSKVKKGLEYLATGAIIASSAVSGALKIVEWGVDGGLWVASKLIFWKKDEIKDLISKDLIGMANKQIFENTKLGRTINDYSKWKYNGKQAMAIQKGAEIVTVFALATAATVATGGGAAAVATPLLAGFLEGTGKKAESVYIKKKDTTFKDEAGVFLAGVAEAANWYAKGKLGQGLLKVGGAIKSLGIKNVGAKVVNGAKSILSKSPKEMLKGLKNILRGSFNKTNFSRAVSKSVRDGNNLAESTGIIADNVGRWVNGDEEFNLKSALKATKELGIAWAMNITFDAFSEYLTKAKRIQDIPEMNDAQKSNLDEIFNREHEIANGKAIDVMESYREHAELHTEAVREYAVMLGLDLDTIDDQALAEIYYAAYFHDLGMECGFVDVDGQMKGVYYKNGQFVGFLEDFNPEDIPDGQSLSELYGITGRKNHPLNSALEVLSDDLLPEGIDKDKVALLALSHSKSTSGVKSFADSKQWMSAVDTLDDAVYQYNLKNNLLGTADEVKFDADRMRQMLSDPNSPEFKKFVDQALCIRDADAMSDIALENGRTKMQSGGVAHVDSPSYDFSESITEEQELRDISDVVHKQVEEVDPTTGKKTITEKTIEIESEMGKKYHAGEENVLFDSTYDGKNYNAKVELNDPHKVPHSSGMNIQERIMEGATYTNCDSRNFEIELPKEMQGTEMGRTYEVDLDKFKRDEIAKATAKYSEVYSKYKQGKATADELAAASKEYQQLEDYLTKSVHIVYK